MTCVRSLLLLLLLLLLRLLRLRRCVRFRSVFAPDEETAKGCLTEMHQMMEDLEEGKQYQVTVSKVLEHGLAVSIG